MVRLPVPAPDKGWSDKPIAAFPPWVEMNLRVIWYALLFLLAQDAVIIILAILLILFL